MLVARNHTLILDAVSHHPFDPAFLQVHEVARSEDAGVALASLHVDCAVAVHVGHDFHAFRL